MNYNMRADGRVERMCGHGVGHTVSIPYRYRGTDEEWAYFSHGCDGCCTPEWGAKYREEHGG